MRMKSNQEVNPINIFHALNICFKSLLNKNTRTISYLDSLFLKIQEEVKTQNSICVRVLSDVKFLNAQFFFQGRSWSLSVCLLLSNLHKNKSNFKEKNNSLFLCNIVLKQQLRDWHHFSVFAFLADFIWDPEEKIRVAEIEMSSFGQDFQQFNGRSTKAQVDLSSISSGNLLRISQHPG